MAKERYITRIDQEREGAGSTHGWYVRIFQRTKNPISKLFSDRMHGSKKKALDMARSFRDEWISLKCDCNKMPRGHSFGDHHPSQGSAGATARKAAPRKAAAKKKAAPAKSAKKAAPAKKKAAPAKKARRR